MAIIARISEEDPKPNRPRRLKSIALLPSLFTLASMLCGFAAIYFALEAMYSSGAGIAPEEELTGKSEMLERMLPSFISVGAGLVLIGMFFD